MDPDPFAALLDPMTQAQVRDFFTRTPTGHRVVRQDAMEVPFIRQKRDRQFLPALPERLFCRLVSLPRKAWAVYLVLRLRSRLARSPTITLTTAFVQRFGLTRHDKARGLVSLERAGLITVDRQSRKNPQITLVEETPPLGDA